MNKEKIDSDLALMDDILDSLDKEPEKKVEVSEEYKTLESKYNEEVSKREKIEADYQELYNKYKERFTDAVASSRNYNPIKESKDEPKEEKIIDIRSIF